MGPAIHHTSMMFTSTDEVDSKDLLFKIDRPEGMLFSGYYAGRTDDQTLTVRDGEWYSFQKAYRCRCAGYNVTTLTRSPAAHAPWQPRTIRYLVRQS